MIKFLGRNVAQAAPIGAGTQVTGFSSAYFLFGDPTGSSVGVGYNRTISFSTDSESARTEDIIELYHLVQIANLQEQLILVQEYLKEQEVLVLQIFII